MGSTSSSPPYKLYVSTNWGAVRKTIILEQTGEKMNLILEKILHKLLGLKKLFSNFQLKNLTFEANVKKDKVQMIVDALEKLGSIKEIKVVEVQENLYQFTLIFKKQ